MEETFTDVLIEAHKDSNGIKDIREYLDRISGLENKPTLKVTWRTIEAFSLILKTCIVQEEPDYEMLNILLDGFNYIIHNNNDDSSWNDFGFELEDLTIKLLSVIEHNDSLFFCKFLSAVDGICSHNSEIWKIMSRQILNIFVNNKKFLYDYLKDALKIYICILRKVDSSVLYSFAQQNVQLLRSFSMMIQNVGDFESQADVLEIVFLHILNDKELAKNFFNERSNETKELFQTLDFEHYETDCRIFINAINNSLGSEKKVITINCNQLFFGGYSLEPVKSDGAIWLDVNVNSCRLCITYSDFKSPESRDVISVQLDELVLLKVEFGTSSGEDCYCIYLQFKNLQAYEFAKDNEVVCTALQIYNSNNSIIDFMNIVEKYTKASQDEKKLGKFSEACDKIIIDRHHAISCRSSSDYIQGDSEEPVLLKRGKRNDLYKVQDNAISSSVNNCKSVLNSKNGPTLGGKTESLLISRQVSDSSDNMSPRQSKPDLNSKKFGGKTESLLISRQVSDSSGEESSRQSAWVKAKPDVIEPNLKEQVEASSFLKEEKVPRKAKSVNEKLNDSHGDDKDSSDGTPSRRSARLKPKLNMKHNENTIEPNLKEQIEVLSFGKVPKRVRNMNEKLNDSLSDDKDSSDGTPSRRSARLKLKLDMKHKESAIKSNLKEQTKAKVPKKVQKANEKLSDSLTDEIDSSDGTPSRRSARLKIKQDVKSNRSMTKPNLKVQVKGSRKVPRNVKRVTKKKKYSESSGDDGDSSDSTPRRSPRLKIKDLNKTHESPRKVQKVPKKVKSVSMKNNDSISDDDFKIITKISKKYVNKKNSNTEKGSIKKGNEVDNHKTVTRRSQFWLDKLSELENKFRGSGKFGKEEPEIGNSSLLDPNGYAYKKWQEPTKTERGKFWLNKIKKLEDREGYESESVYDFTEVRKKGRGKKTGKKRSSLRVPKPKTKPKPKAKPLKIDFFNVKRNSISESVKIPVRNGKTSVENAKNPTRNGNATKIAKIDYENVDHGFFVDDAEIVVINENTKIADTKTKMDVRNLQFAKQDAKMNSKDVKIVCGNEEIAKNAKINEKKAEVFKNSEKISRKSVTFADDPKIDSKKSETDAGNLQKMKEDAKKDGNLKSVGENAEIVKNEKISGRSTKILKNVDIDYENKTTSSEEDDFFRKDVKTYKNAKIMQRNENFVRKRAEIVDENEKIADGNTKTALENVSVVDENGNFSVNENGKNVDGNVKANEAVIKIVDDNHQLVHQNVGHVNDNVRTDYNAFQTVPHSKSVPVPTSPLPENPEIGNEIKVTEDKNVSDVTVNVIDENLMNDEEPNCGIIVKHLTMDSMVDPKLPYFQIYSNDKGEYQIIQTNSLSGLNKDKLSPELIRTDEELIRLNVGLQELDREPNRDQEPFDLKDNENEQEELNEEPLQIGNCLEPNQVNQDLGGNNAQIGPKAKKLRLNGSESKDQNQEPIAVDRKPDESPKNSEPAEAERLPKPEHMPSELVWMFGSNQNAESSTFNQEPINSDSVILTEEPESISQYFPIPANNRLPLKPLLPNEDSKPIISNANPILNGYPIKRKRLKKKSRRQLKPKLTDLSSDSEFSSTTTPTPNPRKKPRLESSSEESESEIDLPESALVLINRKVDREMKKAKSVTDSIIEIASEGSAELVKEIGRKQSVKVAEYMQEMENAALTCFNDREYQKRLERLERCMEYFKSGCTISELCENDVNSGIRELRKCLEEFENDEEEKGIEKMENFTRRLETMINSQMDEIIKNRVRDFTNKLFKCYSVF